MRGRALEVRWNRVVLAVCLCGAVGVGSPAWGREFEVRLLKGKAESGFWGTSEFRCHVNSLGVVRHVSVRGKKIFQQAVALYTRPFPPGAKRGIRVVQGEGFGARGLSVEAPKMTTRDEKGTRVFEFEHLVANKKVLNGKPLSKIHQKISITPTGEIHVTYDIEWLHTLRWGMFAQLLMYDIDAVAGREYLAIAGDRVYEGKLDPGPILKRRIRNVAFDRLTVRPEVGPVHVVWRAKTNGSFHWAKSIQLMFRPEIVPRRGFIYKGSKDRISYSILLPVSQQ